MRYPDFGPQLRAPAGRPFSGLRRLFAAWMRRMQIARTYSILYGLDDRTLADIGLHRSNLRWAARELIDAAERYDHATAHQEVAEESPATVREGAAEALNAGATPFSRAA